MQMEQEHFYSTLKAIWETFWWHHNCNSFSSVKTLNLCQNIYKKEHYFQLAGQECALKILPQIILISLKKKKSVVRQWYRLPGYYWCHWEYQYHTHSTSGNREIRLCHQEGDFLSMDAASVGLNVIFPLSQLFGGSEETALFLKWQP